MTDSLWGIKALIAIYVICWLLHDLFPMAQLDIRRRLIDVVGIVLALAVMFAFVVAYHIR